LRDEAGRILDRVRHLLRRYVLPARLGPLSPLCLAAHPVPGEPVPYEVAVAGPWEPCGPGWPWGADWDTCWFRIVGRVPEGWAGEEVVLRADLGYHGDPGFGAEGLLWREGAPLAGVSSCHQEVTLATKAQGGELVELYLEAAANPVAGGERLLDPDPGGAPRLHLGPVDLAVRNQVVDALALDLAVLAELARALPLGEPRRAEVLAALREACAALDPRALESSAKVAHDILAQPLGLPAAPGAHRVSAVGHAHIDTAWLWPVREARRKCARTLATALTLMDAYPGYRFACSQAQHHAWMRQSYPELFGRMRRQVAEGRLEPVGSMWVEADCNLPSGESLVRQLLYGKRFYLSAYGVETTDCWLPDAFGYPASLPQILARAGVRAFISQKLSWNDANRFPHHSFWWEGIDGTRVLAHFPPADTYNGDFSVAQLRHGVANFADHGRSAVSLYPFGYGDGGGGPNREMLERAARVADLGGLPRVRIEPVKDFLDRLAADGRRLATWVGELYLEFHRGTYTSQARTKAANRQAEMALRAAELWSSGVAALRGTETYPAGELHRAWEELLLHQFHDILPGSSINWVYRETGEAHARVLGTARQVSSAALGELAGSVDTSWASSPVVVFNPAGHPRHETVLLPELSHQPPALAGGNGKAYPVQRAHDGSWLARVPVPPCGWASFDLEPRGALRAAAQLDEAAVEAAPDRLENGLLRLTLDADGVVSSIFDKVAGREVVATGERANLLQLFDDEPPHFDAWDIDDHYQDRTMDLTALDGLEVVESGPLRAGIRLRRSFGSSTMDQVVWLHAGSARVDFETEVDWHERHRLLKVAFPVAVRASHARFEIQFGHVERPTHANTSWDEARFEVCAHRWADLSEAGYGVALLNDSKYGYDVRGHTLRLSLLRGPTSPDPQADLGRHRFTYALLPHQGGMEDGRVVEEGLALNMGLESRVSPPSSTPGPLPRAGSLASAERHRVVIDTLKLAEDGDALILRAYEAHGGRGPVRILLGFPVSRASRVDLMERELEPLPVERVEGGSALSTSVGPFEVLTCKLSLSSLS
jgi:alpha-mannosidase